MISAMPWPLYSQKRASVLIVEEVGLALGLVWTGVEKRKSLAFTGV
jgi:hypothetical protein